MFRAVPCSSSGGQTIITASGIVAVCKRPYSMPVESGNFRSQPAYCTAVYRERRYQRL